MKKAIHFQTQLSKLFRMMYNIAIQFVDIDFVEVVEVEPMGISTNKNHPRVRRTRLLGFSKGGLNFNRFLRSLLVSEINATE